MNIKINDSETLNLEVKYNKEVYNNLRKGFILYATKYTIKEESGYITKKFIPMDKCNFKQILKHQNRYSKKTENTYNKFIEDNINILKDLYLKNDYMQIINLVRTAI